MDNTDTVASLVAGASYGVISNYYYSNRHGPLPVDPEPYTGGQLEYRIFLIRSELKEMAGIMCSTYMTYLETVKQQYMEWFKLDTFYRVPYSLIESGSRLISSYQAILSRPIVFAASIESWELHVETSTLIMRIGSKKVTNTNMSDIYHKIKVKKLLGGRLICLDFVGNNDTERRPYTTFSVNLFFNMPLHQHKTLYTYESYVTPMTCSGSEGNVHIKCDFLTTFKSHLDNGWRLIDIIIPQHLASVGTSVGTMQVIWFFEKELFRFNAGDMTAYYEGTMVDIFLPITPNEIAHLDIRSVVKEMGQKGWSLVCVLDTPKISHSISTVIAFFQRSIMSAPPPRYSLVVG